jgi:DNA-binding MarR family transcriptional regulator
MAGRPPKSARSTGSTSGPVTGPLSEREFAWRGRSSRTQAQVEVELALIKVVSEHERELTRFLKASDLSVAQYNVLRILRGGGVAGLTCGDVTERLLRHDPDVTRLNDRLERRGLIERTRDTSDRRIVRTRITRAGLALLAKLDDPIDRLHEKLLGHMSDRELSDLRVLIEVARTGHR